MMTTETKASPKFKIAFWLAVMLFCDYGLFQIAVIVYHAAMHS